MIEEIARRLANAYYAGGLGYAIVMFRSYGEELPLQVMARIGERWEARITRRH